MTKLSKAALLEKVIYSFLETGQIPVILEDKHPFLIRLSEDEVIRNVRI
jgi:hypothetical protein